MARAHGSRPALPTKPRPPCHPTVARSRSQSLRSWSTCAWLAQPSPLRWLLRIRFVLAPGELYAHQQADLVESVLWYLTGATKPRLGQASAVLPSLLPSAPASAPPPYHLAPPAILVHRPRHAWGSEAVLPFCFDPSPPPWSLEPPLPSLLCSLTSRIRALRTPARPSMPPWVRTERATSACSSYLGLASLCCSARGQGPGASQRVHSACRHWQIHTSCRQSQLYCPAHPNMSLHGQAAPLL